MDAAGGADGLTDRTGVVDLRHERFGRDHEAGKRGHPSSRVTSEWVLLARPVGIGELHRCRDLGAQRVAVVDRGGDDRAGAALHGPPGTRRREIGTAQCEISVSAAVRLREAEKRARQTTKNPLESGLIVGCGSRI